MAKRYQIEETPFGLCGDPDVLKAPQGALATCSNCVINRDGIVEPRYGADEVSLSGSTITQPRVFFNFDDDLLLYQPAGDIFEFLGNLGNPLLDEDSNGPALFDSDGYFNSVKARGNLYIGCTDGVRKVTSSSSTDIFSAGILPDVWVRIYTTDDNSDYNWWTTATYIRYVATIQRTDANDVVLESPPCLSECDDHSDGSDRVPTIRIYIGRSVSAGDILRVFRTKMASAGDATGATYYLTYEHTVTSSDVSTGYVEYDDIKNETELSESLYTNPENEGAAQANFRPPAAKSLALYNGSMFFANTIEPPRVSLKIRTMGELGGETEYAGFRTLLNCNITNGSPTIIVGDASGLEVGQYIDSAYFPAETYITAVAGTTITASENSDYTSSTVTIIFHDTITFGYGSTYETFQLNKGNSYFGASGLAERLLNSSDTEYLLHSTDHVFFRSANNITSVTIERRTLNSAKFYVWATNGESYEPVLSGPTYSGGELVFSTDDGLESDMLIKPGRIFWSKNGQPEHVPIGNFKDIGDASPILSTEETKDGLLVFKDDGVYTVIGEGAASGWSVRLLDRDNTLVCPRSTAQASGWVYAVTNHGLVKVNMNGVYKVSTPFVDYGYPSATYNLLEATNYLIGRRRSGSPVIIPFVEYDRRGNNIIIGLDYNYEYTDHMLIFNLKTERFTSWEPSSRVYGVLSNDSNYNYLYYGGLYCSSYNSGTGNIYFWRDNLKKGADNERSVTVDTKPDSTTINFTTDHYAEVGDYVVDGSEQQEILEVTDSDTVVVADNSNISGACDIYTPFTSTIKWLPKFGETRAFRKNFVAYGLIFRVAPETYSIVLVDGGSTYGPYTVTKTTERRLVPVACARKLFVEPEIAITDLVNEWQLVGVSLEYFLQKPRGV